MITIVDYGAGNIFSIVNMFRKIDIAVQVSADKKDIEKADKLILPGVGAFDSCVGKMRESGLLEILHARVTEDKTPVLGICAGMQLMMEASEEGVLLGLGWIKGNVIKFEARDPEKPLKIPHMGWSELNVQNNSLLFAAMYPEPRFYFAHSYYVVPENGQDVVACAEYGYSFTACIEHDNILGVQFHPEKSHQYGMKLLENFATRY